MAFRILSFSGGGMRGIFQAVVVRKLFESGVTTDDFELIAGTSTGAIVAASIACGKKPEDLVKLFNDLGPKVFDAKTFGGLRAGGEYDSTELHEALKRHFEDRTLASTPKLFVAATNVDAFAHTTFFADEYPHLPLAEVVAASCAAPTYFAPVKPSGQARTFVDGGLWANDPSMSAMHFALRRGAAFDDLRVLSVGNGRIGNPMAATTFANLRKWSVATVRTLLDLMFAAQESAGEDITRRAVGDGRFIAVNATLSRKVDLDDWKTSIKDLPALAEQTFSGQRDSILKAVAEWRKTPWKPHDAPLVAAADYIRSHDILGHPWLYELTETIRLVRGSLPSDANQAVFVSDVASVRRGRSVPERMNICCVLDDAPPPDDAYYVHEIGPGLLSAAHIEMMRRGLKLELLADHYEVVEIAVRRSTDQKKVVYERGTAKFEAGGFHTVFAKPANEDVSDFDTVLLHVRTYLRQPDRIGWYTFYNRFNVTERLIVEFECEDDFIVKRNRIPGITAADSKIVGDYYYSKIEVDRPVMANRSIDFMFKPREEPMATKKRDGGGGTTRKAPPKKK